MPSDVTSQQMTGFQTYVLSSWQRQFADPQAWASSQSPSQLRAKKEVRNSVLLSYQTWHIELILGVVNRFNHHWHDMLHLLRRWQNRLAQNREVWVKQLGEMHQRSGSKENSNALGVLFIRGATVGLVIWSYLILTTWSSLYFAVFLNSFLLVINTADAPSQNLQLRLSFLLSFPEYHPEERTSALTTTAKEMLGFCKRFLAMSSPISPELHPIPETLHVLTSWRGLYLLTMMEVMEGDG